MEVIPPPITGYFKFNSHAEAMQHVEDMFKWEKLQKTRDFIRNNCRPIVN